MSLFIKIRKTFDWATCGPQVGHSWDR